MKATKRPSQKKTTSALNNLRKALNSKSLEVAELANRSLDLQDENLRLKEKAAALKKELDDLKKEINTLRRVSISIIQNI